MKVGTRTCLNWNTCDFPFSPSYLNRSNRLRAVSKRNGSISYAQSNLRNELNVLLKRGVHGLYLFAVDPELQAALKEVQPSHALLAVAGDQRPLDRTTYREGKIVFNEKASCNKRAVSKRNRDASQHSRDHRD